MNSENKEIPTLEFNAGTPTIVGPYWVKRFGGKEGEMMYWDGSAWKTGGNKVCRTFLPSDVYGWMYLPWVDYDNRVLASERVRLATRTEAPVTAEMIARFSNPKFIRLLHAGIGMATEAGEFLDQLKRHGFYGKDLDEVNLMEELGDSDWYMNLCCDVLETTMAVIEVANIKKLAKRFGEKFTQDAALLRNIGAELDVLKSNLPKPVDPYFDEKNKQQQFMG